MPQFKKAAMFQDKGDGGPIHDGQQPVSITEQMTMAVPTFSQQSNTAQSQNNNSREGDFAHLQTASLPQMDTALAQHFSTTAQEETVLLPAAARGQLPKFAQSLLATVLSRAREPEPERWSHTWKMAAVKSQSRILGWFPMLMLTDALGMVLVSLACVASLLTNTDQQGFLWLGLLVVFALSFLRILSPIASRVERMLIICTTGLAVYLAPEILSPLRFVFIDEYLHLRTIDDIVRTGHLFNVNSMLPVSSLYPGLEIVTDAFSSLSGLNTFVSGLIVVGVARILVVLSIFLLFEQLTKSARTAGIATMLYMSNSGFFMFDSLFLYEALGLAVGVFLLFVIARMDTAHSGKRSLLLIACLAIGVLTTIHHVSDLFFIGLLIVWTIISKLQHQPLLKMPVAKITLFGLFVAGLWIAFIATPVIGYLASPVVGSFNQLTDILLGMNTARHLFDDHTGTHPTAVWLQLTMLLSLALTTLGIPFAALCLWHRYRRNALPFALGLVSLLYPMVQALRVTSESANLPDRAAPFIFIAVSFALAIFIVQMWPTNKLKWKQSILITVLVSVVFLGGNMLGSGPSWRLMPGSYLVGSDARSIDLESIQMANWSLAQLGPNNRMFANSTNALLLNTYGDQSIVSIQRDKVDIAPVYYATQFQGWELSILQAAHVRYLVVDLRLSTALPAKGYYFEGIEEPDRNITTPISAQSLKKFDSINGFKRIFDSGDIVIYDVGELVNAPKKP